MHRRDQRTRLGSTAHRVLVAVLAVAFVSANLGSFLHEVTERHDRCDEHDRLVHTPSAAVEHGRALAPDDAQLVAGGAAAAGDGHEHCALSMTGREQAETVSPPVVTPGIQAPDHVRLAPRGADRPALATYRLAPKTSPPA